MSCSGLHCAGCGGGAGLPVAAFGAAYGFVWVTEHLAEVIVTSAACGVLAVAAVVALMRWADRRDARRAAATSLWTVRAEVIDAPRQQAAVPPAGQPAIAPAVVNLNFYGLPDEQQAAVIRRALDGRD